MVTDGEDNASRESLEEAVGGCRRRTVRRYTRSDCWARRKAGAPGGRCETIAQRTGGIAFFRARWMKWTQISSSVAHDIRNQYTIGYKPTTPKSAGGYRAIHVEAKAKGYGKLAVRTRSGYYPGQERAPPVRLGSWRESLSLPADS